MKTRKHKRSRNFAAVLVVAEFLVQNSTAEEAKGFDTVSWLDTWLDLPQLALRGQKPSDILDHNPMALRPSFGSLALLKVGHTSDPAKGQLVPQDGQDHQNLRPFLGYCVGSFLGYFT